MTSKVFSYLRFCTSDFMCFEEAHQSLRKTKIILGTTGETEWEGERDTEKMRETSIWHPELVCLCAVFNLDSINISNNALILNNTSFSKLCVTSLK